MATEIKVPPVGESISEVTLVKWLKNDGEWVERDEVIAELESEKATFEINAEVAGTIKIVAVEGDVLKIGDTVCRIDTAVTRPIDSNPEKQQAMGNEEQAMGNEEQAMGNRQQAMGNEEQAMGNEEQAMGNRQRAIGNEEQAIGNRQQAIGNGQQTPKASPVAAAMISDKKVDVKKIMASGPGGKIIKQDVLEALNNPGIKPGVALFGRVDRTEKMSNLRKTISRRLVEAKNSTAMLTTFNEVDMTSIMQLRTKYKDKFKEIHGVGLGFMSFFAKACCYALQEWPAVNAYIDGENIVYHDFCDISIAVSAPKGLVVPVIRNAESLSMAGIEAKVIELATKARENKLSIEEMTGGTFTITNGGVFGSMMSTPIINIPQSAILGMHKIQERPVVVDGNIVVRPMMYLALSYDHRIIDGRESVSFLVRVKELLENPALLLFGKDPAQALLEL